MKKIILSAAILAGFAFMSCSNDDNGNDNCVTCTTENDTQRVCKGDDSNEGYNARIEALEFIGYDCD